MPTPQPDQIYRGITRLFAVLIVGFGITLVAVTLTNGGGIGALGLWLGLGFIGLGAARLYLLLRAPD